MKAEDRFNLFKDRYRTAFKNCNGFDLTDLYFQDGWVYVHNQMLNSYRVKEFEKMTLTLERRYEFDKTLKFCPTIEKDLEIYDVWESPNGNLFIKMSDDYSIAIGAKGNHAPNIMAGDLKTSQYVKSNDITPVKKVGRLEI